MTASEQAELLEARRPLTPQDQMVVDLDAEQFRSVDDLAGDDDVRLGRGRIAGRVVVHHPNGRCNQLILLVKSAPWMQVEPLIGGGPR